MAGTSSSRIMRTLLYCALIATAIMYLAPIYVLIVTSFKGLNEVTLDRMWMLPEKLDFSGYQVALEKLFPNLMNSLMLAIPATVISSLLGWMNGYIISKWQFRGSNFLFTCMLFGMFIPYQSVLIPLIKFLQNLGLYNSIPGLILVHIVYGLPICTLIFRNFYAGVPMELLEALAKIDGTGFFGIYRYVIFPISITGFVVLVSGSLPVCGTNFCLR